MKFKKECRCCTYSRFRQKLDLFFLKNRFVFILYK